MMLVMSDHPTHLTLARRELYDFVWKRPVRTLAGEFGLSDVAIHKVCRRHRIPTPPPGYWAKLQFGKPVTRASLPKLKADEAHLDRITIHRQWRPNLPNNELAEVNSPADPAEFLSEGSPEMRLLEATMNKLERAKPHREGLVVCEGSRLIKVGARAETLPRVRLLLEALLATAKANSISVIAQANSAKFMIGDESVSFSVEEVTDQVPHEPTDKELKAVAKWEADRAATLKRGGYWWERNPPPIPKWERRYQGRLAVRLEEVRARSEDSYWGTPLRVTYGDAGKRKVETRSAVIIAAAIRIAEAKRNNAILEEKRRLAEEEVARRRAEEARRAALKAKREQALSTIEKEQMKLSRLEALLSVLEGRAGADPPVRYARLLAWLRDERDQQLAAVDPSNIDLWLRQLDCFEEDTPEK